MSKEQVMDYVMNTPANTNPNVLSGMLDGISGTQLPFPTESDNGKVLGVDGGEYKLVKQSGGTVEAIKIFSGTVNFGADTNFSGGGGLFLDGKTFGELIGDKKVVNFVTRGIKTASSSSAKPVSVLVQQIGEKDFIVDQDDPEIRNATGTGFHFCRYAREDALRGTIDVYAICI